MKKNTDTNTFSSKVKVIGKTVTICLVTVTLAVFALFNPTTWSIISKIIRIVSPIVYGIMIAVVNKLTHGKVIKKKEFSCAGCPSAAMCHGGCADKKEDK